MVEEQGLTLNLIEVINKLLERVDLKGSEVGAFVAVINALNHEAEQLQRFDVRLAEPEVPDDLSC